MEETLNYCVIYFSKVVYSVISDTCVDYRLMLVNVEVRLHLLLRVLSHYVTTSFVLPIAPIKKNSKAVRGFYHRYREVGVLYIYGFI